MSYCHQKQAPNYNSSNTTQSTYAAQALPKPILELRLPKCLAQDLPWMILTNSRGSNQQQRFLKGLTRISCGVSLETSLSPFMWQPYFSGRHDFVIQKNFMRCAGLCFFFANLTVALFLTLHTTALLYKKESKLTFYCIFFAKLRIRKKRYLLSSST